MKYTLTALIGFTLLASAQEPPAPGTTPPAPGTTTPPTPGAKPPTPAGTTTPAAPGTTTPAPGTPGNSVAPGVPAPVPNITPAAPGGAAGLAARARVLDPNAIVVPEGAAIEKPNMTGLEAAQLYEDHTGKRVIMSSQASQAEVFFVQRGPLTNADIAKYLKAALLIEGLAILPDPLDPDMVRILPSGPATGPDSAPVTYLDDPLDLPTEDQLVSYRMVFSHLKPEEAEKVFQSAIGQLAPSGSMTVVENASSLLIKANSALIRQMIKIKEDIDVASKIGEKWVDVVYADVDEISERLNEIYNEQGSNRSTTRNTRANTPPAPGTPATGGGAGEEIPIKIIPDNRTNRILLVGRPAELIAVEALVKSFDIRSSNKNSASFKLRYVRVGEFMQAAQDAITATLSENAGSSAGGANSSRRLPTTNNNSRTTNNTNNRNNTTGGAGGGGTRASIQSVEIPTAPESVLIGKTHLVGDNLSNTIIVNGPPHHIEIVRNLVEDLDAETQQVALSAVIGSYALGENHNFGIDLAQVLKNSGAGWSAAGRTSFGVPSVVDPSTLDSMANLLQSAGANGQGVSIYGLIGDDFGVFINALENETNFRTLNRTVLVTKNNRVASLSSGTRIAVPSSTFTGGASNGTTTNVEYRDVVLELEIQPLINSDNEITLEISLVKDDLGQNRPVGELTIPDISTEELTTSVTMKNGAAVILGGLITEKDSKDSSGFPVLRRIPGLGRLFGHEGNNKERNELIIMIRPQIIPTSDEAVDFRNRYENYSQYTRDASQKAFPQSLLPQEGTMPAAPPAGSSKSSVRPAAATPPPAAAPEKKESKIRGRTGRP